MEHEPPDGGERLEYEPPVRRDVDIGSFGSEAVTILAWMLAFCTAVLAVAWLAVVVSEGKRRGAEADGAPGGGVGGPHGSEEPRATLADADRLAAQGRYAEAMHHLLIAAVMILRRRSSVEIGDSLTSRELARALRLPQQQQQAFGEIIARVERAWFGEYGAEMTDYSAVRTSFLQLEPPAAVRATS